MAISTKNTLPILVDKDGQIKYRYNGRLHLDTVCKIFESPFINEVVVI